MAYDKEEVEKKAIEVIQKDEHIVFVYEIVSYLPISRRTFYEWNLHESHNIKDALENNKSNLKRKLREKWAKDGNATTEIALYKLIGTDDETDRINSQKTKIEGSGIVLQFPKEFKNA